MRILLLFLFLAYPMLELALMIKVGSAIGIWVLLGIIVATGLIGILVLREHGLATLRRIAAAMAEGRLPLEPVFEGALVGTAGLLLVAPGLITDALGLLLLIPPVRQLIFRWVAHTFPFEAGASFGAGTSTTPETETSSSEPFRSQDGSFHRHRREPREPIIIEGEYERIDEPPVEPESRDRKGS